MFGDGRPIFGLGMKYSRYMHRWLQGAAEIQFVGIFCSICLPPDSCVVDQPEVAIGLLDGDSRDKSNVPALA